MGLEMLGLKKDMEAAMEGAKTRKEMETHKNLKNMYKMYVMKMMPKDKEEEQEMEKMKPGRGERGKKMMMAKKSLGEAVRLAFLEKS